MVAEIPFAAANGLKRTTGAIVIKNKIVVLHKTKKAPVLQLMLF
jgi:hypothetical protein